MDIIVTVKQVADPSIPPPNIVLDPTGKRIVSPFGIRPVINGYDANAIEEALKLREQHGGRVTVLSLGEDSSRESLKHAIAMGADSAILLNDADWLSADSAGVGRILAAGIRKIGHFDLILCGRQASDTDGAQVLYWIADTLQLPVISPVSKIERADARTLTVQRLIEDGYQRLSVDLPALFGISSEINEPRYPRPRGVMAAARAHIPGWKAADVELQALVPKVTLRQLQIQLPTGKAELMLGNSDEEKGEHLATRLHELGII